MRLLIAGLILSLALAATASVFAIWPVVTDAPWESGSSGPSQNGGRDTGTLVAWWGAITGTIGVIGTLGLSVERLREDRRRPVIEINHGAIGLAKSKAFSRMVIYVNLVNPSTRPVTLFRPLFDTKPHLSVSVDELAEESYTKKDPRNIPFPVTLAPGDVRQGHINCRVLTGGNNLPSFDELMHLEHGPETNWDGEASLIVEDSFGRRLAARVPGIWIFAEGEHSFDFFSYRFF